MKKSAFISALFILLIAVWGIFSCVIALSKTDSLLNLVNNLPNTRASVDLSDIHRISENWDKVRNYLSLIVKNDYLTSAELALRTLEECAVCGTDCEFLCAKRAFLVSLEAISSSCEISFQSFM